jgi:tetratricopeptide (TPR) repeat protein
VCDVDPADVPDLLASLIDKSLLQPIGGGRRLRMLETIREYGAERLAERAELAAVRARHAEHFAAVLAEALPHLITAGQLPWFALLADERDNILAAMRYRCDAGEADAALTIGIGLATYAMMLGNHAEISGWMADALAVPGGDPELRLVASAMLALNTAATGATADEVAGGMRDLGPLARRLGDLDVDRSPLLGLLRSAMAFFAGDAEMTERYMQQTLDGADDWARASVRMFRANIAENNGDVAAMRGDIETALQEFRALGERWGLASTLRGLAALHTLDGRLDEAAAAYGEALRLAGELNSSEDEGFMLSRLADIELRRGDVDAARRHMLRARETAEERGAPIEAVFTLAMLGAVEHHAGNRDEARVLHREAMRRLEALPPTHPAQGHIRAILLALAARTAFDEDGLATARRFAHEAFTAAVGTRDLPIVAAVGVTLAEVAANAGDPAGAATMLGAAARLRGADDPTNCEIVRLTERLTLELGADRFAALYAHGKALERDAAIERLTPA